MKLRRIYTVEESWENDTKGNAQAIYDLLMKDIIDASTLINVVIAVFENNNASNENYKADFLVKVGGLGKDVASSSIRKNRTNTGGMNSDRSMWASVGTVIKVYSAY